MAVPRLFEIALRLQLAHHEAAAEDRLDEATPLVRLAFRPWRGPWTRDLSPPESVLELEVTSDPDPGKEITLRTWIDRESPEPTQEVAVAKTRLSAAWLEGVVVEFVQRVLARA